MAYEHNETRLLSAKRDVEPERRARRGQPSTSLS
jgi:hypothetical protein